jgi:hypothetical protein
MRARTKVLAPVAGAIVALTLLVPVGSASAAPIVLEATLTGPAEVPGPGDADATGVARIRINVRTQTACFLLVVKDMALPATAAHIHAGAAGVAGDIVVTLGAPDEVGSSGFGLATGCARDQARATLRAIRDDPGAYYVNVHNAEFPAGAVRGQLDGSAPASGGGGGGPY